MMKLIISLCVMRPHALAALGVAVSERLTKVHHGKVGKVWHPCHSLKHVKSGEVARATSDRVEEADDIVDAVNQNLVECKEALINFQRFGTGGKGGGVLSTKGRLRLDDLGEHHSSNLRTEANLCALFHRHLVSYKRCLEGSSTRNHSQHQRKTPHVHQRVLVVVSRCSDFFKKMKLKEVENGIV